MDRLLLRPNLVGVRVSVRVRLGSGSGSGSGFGCFRFGVAVGLGTSRYEHTVTKLLPTMASGIDMKRTPATMATLAITWPASVAGVVSP